MHKRQLDEIVRKHGLWLADKPDGERANLSYADLSYANLSSAKNIIIGPQRSDGYLFMLVQQKSSWHVIAGCQDMTVLQYRVHVLFYDDERKRVETGRILDYLEARLADEKTNG